MRSWFTYIPNVAISSDKYQFKTNIPNNRPEPHISNISLLLEIPSP